jgi:D-galactarolactone isomerase
MFEKTAHCSGDRAATLAAPANAADCHIHIFDQRFRSVLPALADATVENYRDIQKRTGTKRVVIVQARPYMTDNDCTLDAVAQFGGDARGIAVVNTDVTDAELKRLDAGGIRGIRFAVLDPKLAAVPIDAIAPLARRIAPLGWHVQIHMSADQIVEHASMLASLPTEVVFDHLGRLPLADPLKHQALDVISGMLQKRRAWVKLAGAYFSTSVGAPGYADTIPIAQAFVRAAPDRMVWGSDWPHPTEAKGKPDAARLFDLLADWVPDAQDRHRVLVTNPEALYGFGG